MGSGKLMHVEPFAIRSAPPMKTPSVIGCDTTSKRTGVGFPGFKRDIDLPEINCRVRNFRAFWSDIVTFELCVKIVENSAAAGRIHLLRD